MPPREHWIKDRRTGKTACGRRFPVAGGATESIAVFDAALSPCGRCKQVLDGPRPDGDACDLHTDKRVYIYGLIDPRDYTLRYIGQSTNPHARVSGHLNEMFHFAPGSKREWLYLMFWECGLRPRVIVLGDVPAKQADAAEKMAIEFFAAAGARLTNVKHMPPRVSA